MRRRIIAILAGAAVMAGAAPVFGFSFAPSDAWNLGAGFGYLVEGDSGKIAYEARTEVPAMGLFKFLSVIPGFAFRVGMGYDTDLFLDVATMIRMRPVKPVMVNVGGGVGYNLGVSLYFPVVAGINVSINKKVALVSNVSYLLGAKEELDGALRITAGVAITGRYEN